MSELFFDAETHPIKSGMIAPRLVCGQFGIDDGDPFILLRDEAVSFFEQHLKANTRIVTFNGSFDVGVFVAEKPALLPLVRDKFNRGEFYDLMLSETLMAIAQGELKFSEDEDGNTTKSRFDLASCYLKRTGRYLKKGGDTFRLKYGLLDGVPLNEWPAEAVQYALDDVHATRDLYRAELAALSGDVVPNLPEQHRAAFALHAMSMWGLRTDEEATLNLKAQLEHDVNEAYAWLKANTNFLGKFNKKSGREAKSTKAIQAAVVEAYTKLGLSVPMTDPSNKFPEGQVKTSKETLQDSGDEKLLALANVMNDTKLLTSFIPVLMQGTKFPICARYNTIVDTGRTSCSAPNVQQLPRKGGVRECFVARPGQAFVFVDFDTLELRALSQVCLDLLGYSEMARALIAGQDLHLRFAADLMGITYEEAVKRKKEDAVKEARQFAKIGNFGLSGGLSAPTLVSYAKTAYGTIIEPDKAVEIKERWFATWPEMPEYFRYIKRLLGRQEECTITQLRSGRVRGGCRFTAAANGFFQSLAGDYAKDCLWNLWVECYTNPSSAVYGSRPVAFIHDEIVMETPYNPSRPEISHAAAYKQAEIMISSKTRWIPDVPVTASPTMCLRWYKGAEPVFDESGWLVPSRPEGKDWVRDDDGKLR